jgi:hypothetical protein
MLQMESQTTFGSQFKTRIEGNTMFCDFYSPSTRTYCKRLRVMCPEHYKEPKVPETRVSFLKNSRNLGMYIISQIKFKSNFLALTLKEGEKRQKEREEIMVY